MVKPSSILVRRLNIALQDDLTTFQQRLKVKESLVAEVFSLVRESRSR
jgi:hypothetical protein